MLLSQEDEAMLTIHGGRTGILWATLEKQVALSRSENKRCLLLVPEQYTLQAEKNLLHGLKLPGFFDIEVFSYSRFIQRLFLMHNPEGRTRVDGSGKNIALARALIKCRKDMRYYSRAAVRKGFVAQCGEWIADMKRAEVYPAQLAEYASSLPESAYRDKMTDLSLAYAEYANVLQGKFVDGEDVLASAIEAVPLSGIVKDCDVFVYGFDVITDDFARLLCAISQECCAAHVYLVMDREDSPDGDCFAPVRQSAERLRARLRQAGVRREWLWCEEQAEAFSDLSYLERNLLRPAAKGFDGIPRHVSLFSAATPYTEVHHIAQQIVALLDQGVSADSISVLCGDMTQYAPLFDAVFSSYGIPTYLNIKEPLATHGLTRLLMSAVRAATGGYRQEDMLSLIKSGFTPLEEQEIWALENYVLRYGISGVRWHNPFQRGSEAEREVPERARAVLSPALLALQSSLREAKSGAASLRALMDYLTACDAYHMLLKQEEALMHAGFEAEAVRARQVWAHVIKLFEQMHEIAGDSRIPGTVMVTWLEAGLLDEAISALPPSSGCITVGEIGNLIVHAPDYLFACAMNSALDDSSDSGLLSQEEKHRAGEDMHAYLGMTVTDRDRMSELDIWKVLSAPQKHLYISYAQASQAGAALRCAQAVSAIKRIFPQLPEAGGVQSAQGAALHPLSSAAALDELGGKLRSGSLQGEWLSAWRWLLQDESHRAAALTLLSAVRGDETPDLLPPRLAQALFTDRIVSVSRLESFAACPYSHFVTYGLRPEERREWQIDRSETGMFYHAAMEGFTRSLAADARWPNITRRECDQLMDAVLQPLTENWKNQVMDDTARARAEGKRYINVCKRVAWAFTKAAGQSSFRPDGGEVAFGYPGGPPALTLTLSDGTKVYVRGRIDRVDRFESDESVYLRVVDYKSGAQTLDPARIWMGMQLQLLLYLEAVLQAEKGAVPAGAFYQWMGDPLIDQQKKGLIESEIAKKLCLKGVMLSDVQVIEWMDNGKPPLGIEDVLKKDGTVKKGKLACSLDEMHGLIQLAHDTAVRLTEEIRRGGIEASPVCDKSNVPHCKFCDFAGVCRRDAHSRAHERPLPDMNFEDLVGKM